MSFFMTRMTNLYMQKFLMHDTCMVLKSALNLLLDCILLFIVKKVVIMIQYNSTKKIHLEGKMCF